MELIRPIVRLGNSAGVVLPKEWLNGKAKVQLIVKPSNPEKEVLEILSSYLEDIQGIYLVGSYARNEQTPESDIDIIVVSNNTKRVISSGKYNIQIFTLGGLVNTIKNAPVTILPSILEAKSILNAPLLDYIRQLSTKKISISGYLSECKRIININKGFIALDRKNGEFLKNKEVVYSAILRLRGIYIARLLLENKKYTKQGFLSWLKSNLSISKEDLKSALDIYTSIKDDKKIAKSVNINIAEALIVLLEKEVISLGKKKKAS